MRRIFAIAVVLFMMVSAHGQTTYSRYDVNRDGKVDVQDVNFLLGKLLSHDGQTSVRTCDVNADGSVSVTDLTWLIDRLLLRRPDSYVDIGIRIMTEEAERLGPTSVRLKGSVLGLDDVDALYSVCFLYSRTNPDPRINGTDVKRVTANEDRKDMSCDVLEGLTLGGTYYCRLAFITSGMDAQEVYYGPVRPFKTDDPVTPGAEVDMGYGFIISSYDVGAETPEAKGDAITWQGLADIDMEPGWRVLSRDDVDFMRMHFTWEPIEYRDTKGYLVRSINGNAVFLTESSRWTSTETGTIAGYAYSFNPNGISSTATKRTLYARTVKRLEGDRSGTDANGRMYVDLGLSACWATCNVGADAPVEYGDHYGWGETSGYYDGHTSYNWSVYQLSTSGKSSWTFINKYQVDDKQKTGCWYSNGVFRGDGKTELEAVDDVANVKWGGEWRMPTEAQLNELIDECRWTWDDNRRGYTVTGPNGNSIYLPAAGYRYTGPLGAARILGCYWSRSLNPSNTTRAYVVEFDYDNVYDGYLDRYCGQSVRAVHP